MNDLFDTLAKAEQDWQEYIDWQVANRPTRQAFEFAQLTAKACDVLKYAALLYPKFIKVEGVVVLEDHYREDNWKTWRKRLDPMRAAAMINHVHVDDFLCNDFSRVQQLEDWVGRVLAFFWQMAADGQFPDDHVVVEYNGDVINIFQEGLK